MKNFLFTLRSFSEGGFNLLAFCAFALLTQTLQAQSISSADQKGIEECFNAGKLAFEKMDASILTPWFTENAEQVIPTGEIIRGRANIISSLAGYMGYLKSLPKPDRMEEKLIASQHRYLASDLILATHTDETTVHFGSEKKVEKTATTVVLKKQNGKWLIEMMTLTPVNI